MKLFYRGSSYEYQPSQVGSQKKGLNLNQSGEPQPTFSLKYRGTSYLVDPNLKAPAIPAQAAHTLSYHGNTYLVDGVEPDVKGVFTQLALVW